MTLKTLVGTLAASGLAFSLTGCAHQQQTKTEEAPPPAPAVAQKQTPAPAPAAQADSQENQDLEGLIRGMVIRFEFNQDILTADSRSQLQKLADVMRKRHEATVNVKIAGNCDERGTEEYNLALGQRRAEVAKKYMVGLGVEPRRVDTISYGKEKPADPRHTEDAWATNRRDDFQPQ